MRLEGNVLQCVVCNDGFVLLNMKLFNYDMKGRNILQSVFCNDGFVLLNMKLYNFDMKGRNKIKYNLCFVMIIFVFFNLK